MVFSVKVVAREFCQKARVAVRQDRLLVHEESFRCSAELLEQVYVQMRSDELKLVKFNVNSFRTGVFTEVLLR